MKFSHNRLITTTVGIFLALGAVSGCASGQSAQQEMAQGSIDGKAFDDVHQTHILTRLDATQTDITNAREAQRITPAQENHLQEQLDEVRNGSSALVRSQGFLSAAERASYDRMLDSIETQLR